jgi:hypothetical protein
MQQTDWEPAYALPRVKPSVKPVNRDKEVDKLGAGASSQQLGAGSSSQQVSTLPMSVTREHVCDP